MFGHGVIVVVMCLNVYAVQGSVEGAKFVQAHTVVQVGTERIRTTRTLLVGCDTNIVRQTTCAFLKCRVSARECAERAFASRLVLRETKDLNQVFLSGGRLPNNEQSL
jgi:hypothetical protein